MNVQTALENGQAVGLKLVCYHLEYFFNPIHFGHYAAIYGYDEQDTFLVDTLQQGSLVKTSLKSLANARSEKGPMSSRNLSYTLTKTDDTIDLECAVTRAIKNNANTFLNPPIRNIAVKGIRKASTEIPKWFKRSKDVKRDFITTAMLMEKAGTGGALFRNFYRDFLAESFAILGSPLVQEAHEIFSASASNWTKVANLLEQAGESGDYHFIEEASNTLETIADDEEQAMKMLLFL